MNYFYFLLLTSITFFTMFLFNSSVVYSQTNNPPVISSLTIATSSQGTLVTSIDLAEHSNKTIYIHGSASDADSCEQINEVSGTSTWKVAFFRTDVANAENCTPDNRDCYQDTEQNSDLSNCDNPADTTLDYQMTIPVVYYADATDNSSMPDHATTDWTAFVEVTDDNESSVSSSLTAEINTLKAMSVTSVIEYGTIALGASSEEQTLTVSNTGNDDDLDALISDLNGWTCLRGSFGSGQVHFATSPLLGWESGTAVTVTPADMGNLSLMKSSDGTASTTSVYFTLKLPEFGLSGACTSNLVIGAG